MVLFLSKVIGVFMVEFVIMVSLGYKLKDLVNIVGFLLKKDFYVFKVFVFLFEKLFDVEVLFGFEMKLIGEVMGILKDYYVVFYKGFVVSGIKLLLEGGVFFIVVDFDKNEIIFIVEKFEKFGFKIYVILKIVKYLNFY